MGANCRECKDEAGLAIYLHVAYRSKHPLQAGVRTTWRSRPMTTHDPGRVRGVDVYRVTHESTVAAIQTAEGTAALLEAGLMDRLRSRCADVHAVEVPLPSRKVVGEIGRSFSVAAVVAERVRSSFDRGRLPIVLSGSCHTALGSVAGLPTSTRGVLWLDAHGDFNTPDTSPSGLLDGTTLAIITGRCWSRLGATVPGFEPVPDESIVMIGVRQLDAGEASLLEDSEITMISAIGDGEGAERALRRLHMRADALYVHLDLDVLDPSVGTANEYAVPHGLSRSQLQAVLGAARKEFAVRALAITSYDPRSDRDGGVRTAAVDAALSFTAGGTGYDATRDSGPPAAPEAPPRDDARVTEQRPHVPNQRPWWRAICSSLRRRKRAALL